MSPSSKVGVPTGHRLTGKLTSYAVPSSELDADNGSPWFIFNDFMVHNISEQEVLSFPGKWKVSRYTSVFHSRPF